MSDNAKAQAYLQLAKDSTKQNEDLAYAYSYHRADRYGYPVDDYANKISALTKAIQSNPNPRFGIHYFSRAMTYDCIRIVYGKKYVDYNKMLEDYNRAIEIEPDSIYYYKGRKDVYKRLGEKEKAKADAQKIKELKNNKKSK